MRVVLVLFAIAAVGAGAVLMVNQRRAAEGRRSLPGWLVGANLVATTVTLILTVIVVSGVG